MGAAMNDESDDTIKARLKNLTADLPAEGELSRLLANIEDPANDEPSKDRYVALVAAGLVDEALRRAIEVKGEIAPGRFARRISKARSLDLISEGEEAEIERVRAIRNVFSHSVEPVSFASPDIETLTRRLFDHPVQDWAAYFAPVFTARRQFAIVCGAIFRKLVGPSCDDS